MDTEIVSKMDNLSWKWMEWMGKGGRRRRCGIGKNRRQGGDSLNVL